MESCIRTSGSTAAGILFDAALNVIPTLILSVSLTVTGSRQRWQVNCKPVSYLPVTHVNPPSARQKNSFKINRTLSVCQQLREARHFAQLYLPGQMRALFCKTLRLDELRQFRGHQKRKFSD